MQEKEKQTNKIAESKITETVPQEVEYEMLELANNSRAIFGTTVTKESVMAAFRVNNVTKATISDAKKLVLEFLRKEIY